MTENNTMKKIIVIAILIVFAAVSFFWISNVASDPESFDGTLAALDQKESTVMALTAGSTAASCAISLIPGDAGNPIADKLADMSFYFVIILSAIIVEKWIVTISGLVAFKIILPLCALAMVLIIATREKYSDEYDENRPNYVSIVAKMALFAVLVVAIIPSSVVLSNQIEESYQSTIQQTIDEAQSESDSVQKKVGDKQDQNAVEKFFSKVQGGINGEIDKFKTILKNYVEAIAVLIVTTCLIPIAVFAVFVWLIKVLVGVEVKVPRIKRPGKKLL